MHFIDPHIHIASRTTDDLQALATAGCLVVGEPAFWMGYDRSGTGSFCDYFRQLTEWEPKLPPTTASNTTPGWASTPRRRRTSALPRM